MSTTREVTNGSVDLLRNPTRAAGMAQTAAGLATSLGRVTLMLPDSKTLFKGELSVARRTAWSRPLPLDAVKAVGRATGATVNDVIVASVAGALRSYMQGRGQAVDGIDVRAMVPVDIRSAAEALEKLGNHFGLVVLSLPVGLDEPLGRLHELKRRMDQLKHTPEANVTYGIVQTMGMTPIRIERLVLRFFTSKTSVVMTNVIGPRHKLYLAGNPIRQVNFWVPQTAGIGLGISIFSYAGEVVVGVMANAKLVPDPETIVDAFEAEFAALQALIAHPADGPELRPNAVSDDGHGAASPSQSTAYPMEADMTQPVSTNRIDAAQEHRRGKYGFCARSLPTIAPGGGQSVLLSLQHLDRPGHDLRRCARRYRSSDGGCAAPPIAAGCAASRLCQAGGTAKGHPGWRRPPA